MDVDELGAALQEIIKYEQHEERVASPMSMNSDETKISEETISRVTESVMTPWQQQDIYEDLTAINPASVFSQESDGDNDLPDSPPPSSEGSGVVDDLLTPVDPTTVFPSVPQNSRWTNANVLDNLDHDQEKINKPKRVVHRFGNPKNNPRPKRKGFGFKGRAKRGRVVRPGNSPRQMPKELIRYLNLAPVNHARTGLSVRPVPIHVGSGRGQPIDYSRMLEAVNRKPQNPPPCGTPVHVPQALPRQPPPSPISPLVTPVTQPQFVTHPAHFALPAAPPNQQVLTIPISPQLQMTVPITPEILQQLRMSAPNILPSLPTQTHTFPSATPPPRPPTKPVRRRRQKHTAGPQFHSGPRFQSGPKFGNAPHLTPECNASVSPPPTTNTTVSLSTSTINDRYVNNDEPPTLLSPAPSSAPSPTQEVKSPPVLYPMTSEGTPPSTPGSPTFTPGSPRGSLPTTFLYEEPSEPGAVYECDECHRTFKHKLSLTNHQRAHGNRQPHICFICKEPFKYKTNLKRHLRIHARQMRMCKYCHSIQNSDYALVQHEKEHRRVMASKDAEARAAELEANLLNASLQIKKEPEFEA